jgi:hypothetical protein
MIERMKNMKIPALKSMLPTAKSVAFLHPPKTTRLEPSSVSSSIGNIEVPSRIRAPRPRTPEIIKEVQVKIGKVLDRISPRGRSMVKKNPLKYKMYWEDQAMHVMKSLVPK